MSTVLVVEDNPITRKLVRFALRAQSIDVIEAPDGASALRGFVEQPVSLILLDLLLPDVDGFELLPQLRALPGGKDIPILAFSGLLSSHDEARIASVGFDDVVTKPIEPSRLVQILRAHLPAAEPPAIRPVGGRRIVIADDDGVQRKLVALRLQRAGYEVTLTSDGEAALAAARELKPDAIVSDVLMPRLDGFGLCMAIRSDPELHATPILLITNSYLDAEDQSLARRAGADHLIVRTPELRDVIAVLDKESAVRRSAPAPKPTPIDPELERERVRRMMSQLERQVSVQANLSQRCAVLSAELSVLSGISEAVASQDDIEVALHQVLASCFDAGGISLGTLYLTSDEGLRGLRFGESEGWSSEDIESFFGHRSLLMKAIASQALLRVPSDEVPEPESRRLLKRARVGSLLIAPLGHKGEPLGALVTVSRTEQLESSDRVAFTQAVAGQISLALALARSFQAKDSSEKDARSTATLLGSILESMADGVIATDARGTITHWNGAATNILNVSPGDEPRSGAGIFATDMTTPVNPDQLPLARAMRGEGIDHEELFLRCEGREGTWISVNARPLHEAGTTTGGVAVFRDVTREKAARAQLLVSDRMASLGTLAAGVGHEINNPLMAVLGNLEMAVTDITALIRKHGSLVDFGEIPDELRDARDAAERVRNIVRDLKLFSRTDEESRGDVNVEHVLESSIRMVWNEIRHRARLVRDFRPIPSVLANESRLGQVFLNLIVNAAQAIPEGRAHLHEIRVATSVTSDGRARVDISDTGSGMPPEIVERIFTPFFTTKPIGVGTGLGLAICHQLVTAVGGEILVDTELGKGTMFSVLLPTLAVAMRKATEPPPLARSRQRGRVLVIDDEVLVATTLRRALSGEHDVVGVTDPHEAVRMITAGQSFDVILCDLMMPTATGMDLFHELSQVAPEHVPRMVFITGGAFTAQARTFLDTVPNARLEKPVDLRALRTLVNDRVRKG
jgi:PAS domain S-box-containing protein